jgi:hypothetical protein
MADYNKNQSDNYPHGGHIEVIKNGNLLWIDIRNPDYEDMKSRSKISFSRAKP